MTIHYLEWNTDSAAGGLPIVALHGLASTAHWYERLAARLNRHYRIVAPDQRGHGQTTQAPAGYDWQTLAADVAGFMDALGLEKAAVLGHSWGGNDDCYLLSPLSSLSSIRTLNAECRGGGKFWR